MSDQVGAATAPPGDGNNNSKDDAATGWYEGRADPTGALLGSHKWQQINPSTYKGLVKRLKMIKEAELPPMRVISADKIRELGRIPRSTEGFQQDALEVVQHWGIDTNSWSRAVIIFFSHTWLLPNHCKEAGKDLPWGSEERKAAVAAGQVVGYPDSLDNAKAKALGEYAVWFKQERARRAEAAGNTKANSLKVYYWIDFACVDQTSPGADMAALPAYAAVSQAILSYFSKGYENRAWCRVELMLAHSFMTTGETVLVLPEGFTAKGYRSGLDSKGMTVPDPLEGQLTNPDDRAIIEGLRKVAAGSKSFTCWRIFVNTSTQSVQMCILWNVFICCQCCGRVARQKTRDVAPGKGNVTTLTPLPRVEQGMRR